MFSDLGRAVLSGLVATVLLSLLMIAKSAMGLLPAFDVIPMISEVSHRYIALPETPLVGWIGHFFIGTVLWGALFGASHARLLGNRPLMQGLTFGALAWLAMMVVFMPAAGAGAFAASIGLPVTLVTLVLHLIYGAVLGATFGWLERRQSRQALASAHSS